MVNALCPGFIATAMSQDVSDRIPEQYATPMTTVLKAYDRCIEGSENGAALEISNNEIYPRGPPDYSDDSQKWVIELLGEAQKEWAAEKGRTV